MLNDMKSGAKSVKFGSHRRVLSESLYGVLGRPKQ